MEEEKEEEEQSEELSERHMREKTIEIGIAINVINDRRHVWHRYSYLEVFIPQQVAKVISGREADRIPRMRG